MQVGVYLGSNTPANTAVDQCHLNTPDLKMLPDFVPDHQPQGLLASISEEDLKDTDVYVYRQSNGQMILERKGLWATGNGIKGSVPIIEG